MKQELIREITQLLGLLDTATGDDALELIHGVKEAVVDLETEALDPASEGAAAEAEGPFFSPARTSDPKLAVIVGHTKAAPGACGLAPLDACEYTWNSAVAARMVELAGGMGVECAVFFRDNGLEKAYAAADKWGAQAIIELHYNAASASATGTETLWGRTVSIPWAKAAQKEMVSLLGLKDRGLVDRSKGGRGHRNLTLSKNPSIIVEPFFGSNKKDATIGQQNKFLLARAYLQAFKTFIGPRGDESFVLLSVSGSFAPASLDAIPDAAFDIPDPADEGDAAPPEPTGKFSEPAFAEEGSLSTLAFRDNEPPATLDISVKPLPGWAVSKKQDSQGRWNFYLTHDEQPQPLHIGRSFKYTDYAIPTTGLARTSGMEPRLTFDPAPLNNAFQYWPELLFPTAFAESTANHGVINAWDNAAITLTFLQLAAHVAEDLTPCVKRLLKNLPDEARQWFPELKLVNGKLWYDHKGRQLLLEGNHVPQDGAHTSSWYQGRVMQFFNPSRRQVDPEEVHAAARWLEWTRRSEAMRHEQIRGAIENAVISLDRLHRGLRQHAAHQYPNGVDGMRCDHLGAALAEPHYNNGVTKSIWALQQPDVLDAFTKIRYAGPSGNREGNVVKGVKLRGENLSRLRFDLKLGHPVK